MNRVETPPHDVTEVSALPETKVEGTRDSIWSWHSWVKDTRNYRRYVGFFTVVFLIALYWTFPRTVLRDWLVRTVEQRAGIQLEVDEVDTYWMSGLSMQNVKITRSSNVGEQPIHLEFSALKLRLSFLDLIRGRRGAVITAEAGDGDVQVHFSQSDDTTSVSVDFDAWDLNKVFTTGIYGLPVFGSVTGELDLDLKSEAKESEGAWDIHVDDFALGDGKSEFRAPGLMMGITMDKTRFGRFNLMSDVTQGVAKLKTCAAKGVDAELTCGGSLFLAHPFEKSRSDVLVRFRFTDGYKAKHGWVQGLDALMDFTPQLKGAKTPEGALQYKMTGAFSGLLKFSAAGQLPKP